MVLRSSYIPSITFFRCYSFFLSGCGRSGDVKFVSKTGCLGGCIPRGRGSRVCYGLFYFCNFTA